MLISTSSGEPISRNSVEPPSQLIPAASNQAQAARFSALSRSTLSGVRCHEPKSKDHVSADCWYQRDRRKVAEGPAPQYEFIYDAAERFSDRRSELEEYEERSHQAEADLDQSVSWITHSACAGYFGRRTMRRSCGLVWQEHQSKFSV